MKVEIETTIVNKQGLHARPASLFVSTSCEFDSDILLIKDENEIDGKSLMSILMLAAGCGDKISIIADGDDAEDAVESLNKLVNSGFGE